MATGLVFMVTSSRTRRSRARSVPKERFVNLAPPCDRLVTLTEQSVLHPLQVLHLLRMLHPFQVFEPFQVSISLQCAYSIAPPR
jgi:hypothetical protein